MDTSFWDDQRGVIRSRKGGWQIGKDVTLHGRSLFNDLMGSASWFQVWMLGITGRLPERAVADWCEAIWLCLSFPDPRVWCNHVSALAGTMRCSPVAGVSAGTLTGDALRYSSWALLHSAEFFIDAMKKRCESNLSVEILLETRPKSATGCPIVPGYNRPIAVGDERVAVMDRLLKQYGLAEGEHLKLSLEIHDYLKERHGEQINSGGYTTAFLLDQGLTSMQVYRFFSMAIQAGALSCYIDTFDREAESFMPMRCDDFDYQGTPPRVFPE